MAQQKLKKKGKQKFKPGTILIATKARSIWLIGAKLKVVKNLPGDYYADVCVWPLGKHNPNDNGIYIYRGEYKLHRVKDLKYYIEEMLK